jgi:DNA-binding CsgD family transcriptional regulator
MDTTTSALAVSLQPMETRIADPEPRIDRLSPRHRECLRLVYHRRVTKEIAAELGLSVGTVSTYCTEAIRLLGARDRRHAAELLHDYEEARGLAPPPSRTELDFAGVSEPPLSPPSVSAVPSWARYLPFRHKDAPGNDLTVTARLFWICAIAVALAVGFGSLASGAHFINDIFQGRGSR